MQTFGKAGSAALGAEAENMKPGGKNGGGPPSGAGGHFELKPSAGRGLYAGPAAPSLGQAFPPRVFSFLFVSALHRVLYCFDTFLAILQRLLVGVGSTKSPQLPHCKAHSKWGFDSQNHGEYGMMIWLGG